jgi:hypothetical protein
LDGSWNSVQARSEETHKTSTTLNAVLHPEGEAEFTVPRFDNPATLLSDAATHSHARRRRKKPGRKRLLPSSPESSFKWSFHEWCGAKKKHGPVTDGGVSLVTFSALSWRFLLKAREASTLATRQLAIGSFHWPDAGGDNNVQLHKISPSNDCSQKSETAAAGFWSMGLG